MAPFVQIRAIRDPKNILLRLRYHGSQLQNIDLLFVPICVFRGDSRPLPMLGNVHRVDPVIPSKILFLSVARSERLATLIRVDLREFAVKTLCPHFFDEVVADGGFVVGDGFAAGFGKHHCSFFVR